jgi:hypothetical protein
LTSFFLVPPDGLERSADSRFGDKNVELIVYEYHQLVKVKTVQSPNGEPIKVNAFHPSYAINRNLMHSNLRQLPVLEFVKARAIWSGVQWLEEAWMQTIRDSSRNFAIENAKG